MIVYLFSLLFVLCVGITMFVNLYPSFGGNPTKEEK